MIKVDAIAASFIRKPEDLQVIRALLGEAGKQVRRVSSLPPTSTLHCAALTLLLLHAT